METPRVEPDGKTTLRYVPDTAAGIKALLAAVKEFDLSELPLTAPPKNERPWHKHTLPSRRRK